ncbi:MAG: hypothetical protein QG581_486, partial [Patescibacteria group bacterium]|nr:hypothetical protein [Patescibacteria group bacterium]
MPHPPQHQPRALPKTPEGQSVVSPGSLMRCKHSEYPKAFGFARDFRVYHDPESS